MSCSASVGLTRRYVSKIDILTTRYCLLVVTDFAIVREKHHEAIVECERGVVCVYRRASLRIPLGLLAARRQYHRVVSI